MQIALTRPLVIVHVFVVLSLCMTRPTSSDLFPFDPKIDRTFHRLHRHHKNTDLVDHISVVDSSSISYSESNFDTIFSNLVSNLHLDIVAKQIGLCGIGCTRCCSSTIVHLIS